MGINTATDRIKIFFPYDSPFDPSLDDREYYYAPNTADNHTAVASELLPKWEYFIVAPAAVIFIGFIFLFCYIGCANRESSEISSWQFQRRDQNRRDETPRV